MIELNQEIQDKVDLWMTEAYKSPEQEILHRLISEGNTEEIFESFHTELTFGTGGMRGLMGPGSNRINRFTIGKATQGFSEYLKKRYYSDSISVAVSYDNRNYSEEYAHIVANVFSGNGIKVYLFYELRPTPELSFAIRALKCHGGVMITASHNPKEYNGYKAYDKTGGQLVSPEDEAVIRSVRGINGIGDVKFKGNPKLIEYLKEKMDQKYIDAILKLSLSQDAIHTHHDMPIVYSPIHGTGSTLMVPALKAFGFTNIHTVASQMINDGDFPTVIYPNPEEVEAMTKALQLGKEKNAVLVLATDPDSDRVGIAIPDKHGELELLNGNQMASLLTFYLLERWNELEKLMGHEFFVSTIVTTPLIPKMCEAYGVDCYLTLTGFKHIGKLISDLKGNKKFVGGGEESYGYLVDDLIRDKDGIISGCFIAEMIAFYASRGLTPYNVMESMYEKHGLYLEKLISLKKQGNQGAIEIKKIIENFRKNPPTQFANSAVIKIDDYLKRESKNIMTKSKTKIYLPKSNVLQFHTANGDIISVRPSGTEPKIKFYISVNHSFQLGKPLKEQTQFLANRIDLIESELSM